MVFILGISKRTRKLERRLGGGGGGRGGGGGGSGGGSGGSGGRGGGGGGGGGGGSGGGSSAGNGGRPGSISSGGSSRSTSSRSFGGGSPTTIPQGQPFSGRSEGGGNRNQIYGTGTYGSGYPGTSSTNRGVSNLGFPFFYWPVVFGAGTIGGGAHIYHESNEYGDPNNSSRPGGAMIIATFPSSSVSNSTFRILADNETITSLVPDIVSSCGSQISGASSIQPAPYNDSGPPSPQQAIQYYRASSIVLSLDSYNNSAAFSNDTNTPNSPLPNNIDNNLLSCLNNTIGSSAPLVDGAFSLKLSSPSNLGLVVLVWIVSQLVPHV